MTRDRSRLRLRHRAAVVAITAALVVAGCGGSDDDTPESLTVADLEIDTADEQVMFEELFPLRADEGIDDTDSVTAREAAIYWTSNSLYSDFHDAVVAQALDNWENTEGRLRTLRPGDGGEASIAQVRIDLDASLEPDAPKVDVATFLGLPRVYDITVVLGE